MLVLKLFNSVKKRNESGLLYMVSLVLNGVVRWTIFVSGPVNMEVGDPKVGEVTRLGEATLGQPACPYNLSF